MRNGTISFSTHFQATSHFCKGQLKELSGPHRNATRRVAWLLMRTSHESASISSAASEKQAKNCVPTLSANHLLWWSRTYGANYHAPAAPCSSPNACDLAVPTAHVLESLYEAIRDNRRDMVEALVQHRPHAIFAKRTALYVASFFGRHELVKYFLDRGADKNLRCEGFRPVDVAGFGRDHAIDRMKVQFLLGEEACPRVIICTEDPTSIHTSRATLTSPSTIRLQIHFSEPVEDFISDDIAASPHCRVQSFTMLRRDLYIVDVKPCAPLLRAAPFESESVRTDSSSNTGSATADSNGMFIEVPAGVARRARSGRSQSETLNSCSNRFVLVLLDSPPPPSMR